MGRFRLTGGQMRIGDRRSGCDRRACVPARWVLCSSGCSPVARRAAAQSLKFRCGERQPDRACTSGLLKSTEVSYANARMVRSRELGFRPFLEKQACDIIQPDAQKCGGLLEMKKIADWADLYYLNMLCHNMCTPVGTIASAHTCAAIRSFLALEPDSV